MARLTVLGGVGSKGPAAFLVEIAGRRLLLDLGEGPEPGQRPDLARAGRVDAIIISHAHEDHCAALPLASALGDPPVWATARCLALMPAAWRPAQPRLLPETGVAEVLGLPLVTGPAGHSPGGVWLHLPTAAGGFTYTGDFSLESRGLPFAMPPRAATLLADASYGDHDLGLPGQIGDLVALLRRHAAQGAGAVLCVPAAGRAADMALSLREAGLEPHLCPVLAKELAIVLPGLGWPVVDARSARPDQVILCTGPNGESGLAADLLARRDAAFRFVFSSHVPRGTPAHALIAAGRAQWLRWNVHPRRRDILRIACETDASRVIPAFVDPGTAPILAAALGPRLCLEREIEI